MSPEHGPDLELRSETQRCQHQLTPDAAGHDQLTGGNVVAALKCDATTVGIQVRHRAMFDQLMSGLTGCTDPVGQHFVAAHRSSGGLKQPAEIALRFQRKTG